MADYSTRLSRLPTDFRPRRRPARLNSAAFGGDGRTSSDTHNCIYCVSRLRSGRKREARAPVTEGEPPFCGLRCCRPGHAAAQRVRAIIQSMIRNCSAQTANLQFCVKRDTGDIRAEAMDLLCTQAVAGTCREPRQPCDRPLRWSAPCDSSSRPHTGRLFAAAAVCPVRWTPGIYPRP